MKILIISISLILIIKIIELYLKDRNKNEDKEYTFKGKLNSKILTNNELSFYKKLKNITDKYDLMIFPKIRLADIITTYNYTDFNKIKSIHIDFTICDKSSKPLLFIELDDSTHNKNKNKENDNKKDYIMQSVSIKILRIKLNEIDVKLNYIDNVLNNDLMREV